MRLRSIALALFCFLILAQGISELAIWLGLGNKSAIDATLQRAVSATDTTVLFIGTSRIEYGLDPVRFDAEMEAKGFHTVSYVLGVNALSFVEMQYLLTAYFTRRPCCVKFVFLEPDMASDGSLRQPNSIRSILFFNLSNALSEFTYVFHQNEAPTGPATNWIIAKDILTPLFRHYTNAGIFQSFFEDTNENYLTRRTVNGYIAQGLKDRLADTLADAPQHRQYYETLNTLSAPYSPDHVSNTQFVRFSNLLEYIKARGAEPIVLRPAQFIYAPTSASVVARIRAACAEAFPVLDFGRPSDYEELFDPKNRVDYDHLTAQTAEHFTRMVADKFAALLSSEKGTISSDTSCIRATAQ